ncbi:hypothetical protein ACWEO1_00970 [Kitasatospora cineracea]
MSRRLVLYASTEQEDADGATASLLKPDMAAPRTVRGWWNDSAPYSGGALPVPGSVSGASAFQALRLVQQQHPEADVQLRFGPRAAWQATEEPVPAGRPDILPDVKRLITGLSPGCSFCGTTRRSLEVAHIRDWPETRAAVAAHPIRKGRHLRARLLFHSPWNLLMLCRDRAHGSGCHDRQEAKLITAAELREARARLDRQPHARAHYQRYLDQQLLACAPLAGVDENALLEVLRLLNRLAADAGEAPEPYALNHGQIRVDIAHAMIDYGSSHYCADNLAQVSL